MLLIHKRASVKSMIIQIHEPWNSAWLGPLQKTSKKKEADKDLKTP